MTSSVENEDNGEIEVVPLPEERDIFNVGLKSQWFPREERRELHYMVKPGDLLEINRNTYR